jgi:hypothetical protein
MDEKDSKGESGWVNRGDRKLKDLVVGAYERDHELIQWITEFLGCSRSEAIRTAIRSFAAQMKALEKEVGRPRGS